MDEIIQSYGASLRFILHQKGNSAEELVKKMNQTNLVKTNKPAISRVINGKRIATDEEVQIIANVLESPLLLEAFNLYKQYKDSKDETLLLAFHEVMDRLHSNPALFQEEQTEINYDVLYQLVKGLYKQCLAGAVKRRFSNQAISC
jgi:transcriptional regulator with XRE-family HTH domain